MGKFILTLALVAGLAASVVWYAFRSSEARLPVEAGIGAAPVLPAPRTPKFGIPLINTVTAIGWPDGSAPEPAPGLTVQAFATGLSHPRWLLVLPNGDVLVAETNAPNRPDEAKGLRGLFFKHFQKKAGGAAPSADRITLLRDGDGDGIAEVRGVFIENLSSPFGMTLVADRFFVANTDSLVVFPYAEGIASIPEPARRITDLPAGTLNHHWTKSLVASPDGSRLYVGIGSNSNVAENGISQETDRACIWEIDSESGAHEVFASGLRNPVGMDWNPTTGALWTAVNERDELGSDLVPDYMTSVQRGDFFGWPYSYFGAHVDSRVSPPRPDLVAKAKAPDYALGAHTASRGLAFARGTPLGEAFSDGAFVGQHGSWNRKPRSGYNVIFVPFKEGRPAGPPRDVLGGFVDSEGSAKGRPVGVAVDGRGALFVADDVGNVVWRVSARRSIAMETRR